MKNIFFLTCLLSSYAFAGTHTFHCDSQLNGSEIFKVEFQMHDGQKNVTFARQDQFSFILGLKDKKMELQVYEELEPSRSYATAALAKDQIVELAIWKRDFWLEVSCKKVN